MGKFVPPKLPEGHYFKVWVDWDADVRIDIHYDDPELAWVAPEPVASVTVRDPDNVQAAAEILAEKFIKGLEYVGTYKE